MLRKDQGVHHVLDLLQQHLELVLHVAQLCGGHAQNEILGDEVGQAQNWVHAPLIKHDHPLGVA